MSGLTDRQAAARYGVDPPRDHDHGPKYDGHDALFPKGWDAMDADRHAVPCSDDVRVQQMLGSVVRWRAWCMDCNVLRHGWSKAEALANLKAAHRG